MPNYNNAARTNLDSNSVSISQYELGRGAFRICYSGSYIGGNRNQQEAACKKFKSQYWQIENEFYETDFEVADVAIRYVSEWNRWCEQGEEILMSRGAVHNLNGEKYLVEPIIRNFVKFTSNNGFIASVDDEGWAAKAMEAFSHYTYHRSGGQLIVCDLQGRYRYDRYNSNRCRFELTDPAICSRARRYGPTDMGEKGIDSFFHHHVCNEYCHADGHRWQRPRYTNAWFNRSCATTMMSSAVSHQLCLSNTTTWRSYGAIMEEDSDESDY